MKNPIANDVANRRGPIETIKVLSETLGVDLKTAKVMADAEFTYKQKQKHMRARAELAYARDLLLRSLDDDGLMDELVAEIQEFLEDGLDEEKVVDGRKRIAELEERCREHRAKRAEKDKEIEHLHEKHESWQRIVTALREAIVPGLEALGWPVPPEGVPANGEAVIAELVRQRDVLILHITHDDDCDYHETGCQNEGCNACTDGDTGPILFGETK